MTVLSLVEIERLLAEDVPYGDLTTETLGIGGCPGSVCFTARNAMVVAAIKEAEALFSLAGVTARCHARTGDAVASDTVLLTGEGSATGLHRAWKVAQTLVEIWSGVATATRSLVTAARAARPDIVIACTRKNVPGTKALAIAAIKAGGAAVHRLGLSETILVFPEHRVFRGDGDVASITRDLRARAPEKKLVIEVNSVAEGFAAATAGFDVIQTEKFSPAMVSQLATALASVARRPLIAAAGGINSDNVTAYVQAGADIIVTSWPYTARPADIAVQIKANA
ncbi:ModD protein [Pseudolabrys sp. FHR47]|uniref:ModD protein n=1 Tax=Pseudolabrys sp. FHR47 TaxID=2562284 RepID=UPI0010BEA791|nr:ModD protein [Pseudolabrys sp. FHR47]